MGLLESISSGKYDRSLDRIITACQERKENRIYSLKVGDRVKFGPTVRPEYLRGQKATILSWRRTRVLIQLDDSAYTGRFRSGRIIAHAQGLLPVDELEN